MLSDAGRTGARDVPSGGALHRSPCFGRRRASTLWLEDKMMLSARGRRPSFHLPTLAWAALVLVSSSSFAGPRVNVRQGEWYFGEVYEGATVQHTFEIENVGDAPLHVGQIRSLCAPCTATVVSDNPVMPGGTARLLVTYEAKERLGDVTAGVIVHLDDPEEPFKNRGGGDRCEDAPRVLAARFERRKGAAVPQRHRRQPPLCRGLDRAS